MAPLLFPASTAVICCVISLVGAALAYWTLRGQRRRSLTAQATPKPIALGGYRLGEKLGEGGMGVVYRAEHATFGRCAVKVLAASRQLPVDRERFEREAALTRSLSHANIVEVYDSGISANGAPYYAMECVDGQDLQSLVDATGPLAPARVAHVLAQLASALSEVHGKGLLHRDVKPANVMIDANDQVKLVDFGLVKVVGADSVHDEGSERYIVGTPLYLAPEAIVSPDQQDQRSDLYAIGALGYFLLTGSAPFNGKSLVEVCSHHLHTPVVPPSLRSGATVPSELEELLLRCLEKSPEQRPRDAGTIVAALTSLTAGGERETIAAAPTAPAHSSVYRRGALTAAPSVASVLSAA